MTGVREIHLTESIVRTAAVLWTLFHGDIAEIMNFLEIPKDSIREMLQCVDCACGAEPAQPCITATGKRARTVHRDRAITLIAALYTVAGEPVISEEEQIEDLLHQ